jgi:hypothetical protein
MPAEVVEPKSSLLRRSPGAAILPERNGEKDEPGDAQQVPERPQVRG